MKNKIRFILILVSACGICSIATYFMTYHRGFENGYRSGLNRGIGQGCFHKSIALLAALQKVRTADIPAATELMEKACFDSAHTFYEHPTSQYPDAATVRQVARALSNYRAAYRTNSADWDDMERKLAFELSSIK